MQTPRICKVPHTEHRFALCFALMTLLATPASGALLAPGVTENSVTLSWTAPGDDNASGRAALYDVRYSLAPITASSWNSATQAVGEPAPSLPGATDSFTVTGLNTGTLYYFAVKTADEVPNWSALSNVVSKRTNPESTAPAAVTTLAAGNATGASVTLTWQAPGDDGTVGAASTYDVRYSTAPITAANFFAASQAVGEPTPKTAGSTESFVVSGLAAATTYYFALKTADEVPNWSALSNVASATTASSIESQPPATVANLSALAPTMNSITLVWTAPGDDGIAGTASQYDIRYATAPISAGVAWDNAAQLSDEPAPSPAGTPETLTVTGLSEATTYYFALRTADEVPNWSGVSNSPFATTSPDITPPAAIIDLVAAAGTERGTIDLSWSAPGDDGLMGQASVYEIRYSLGSIDNGNWSQATLWTPPPAPVPAGLPQRITLTGLEPGEVYSIGVKTRDDAGNLSPLSNIDTAVARFELVTDDETVPEAYALSQNYPNPFNPTTQIRVALPQASRATLTVFNTAGQEVATLLDGALPAGDYEVTWDGRDSRGVGVATGVYYYRLVADDHRETRKMMLLK